MNKLLFFLVFGFFSVYAAESEVATSQRPADEVNNQTPQLITEEYAEETGLYRSDSYDIVSTVSEEDLERKVEEQITMISSPYYSVELDSFDSRNEYHATITEYELSDDE